MLMTKSIDLKKKRKKIYYTEIYVCVKDDKSNSIELSFNPW
jgi:hypothetical protein